MGRSIKGPGWARAHPQIFSKKKKYKYVKKLKIKNLLGINM